MLKEHAAVFRRLMIITDTCIIAGVFLGLSLKDIYPRETYFSFLPLFVLTWIFLFYMSGMYKSFRVQPVFSILFIVFKTGVYGFIIFSSIIYILRLSGISRSFVFLIFVFALILLTLEKIILVSFFRYLRKKGYNYRNILLVGTGKRAQHFMDIVKGHSEWGLKIIGLIDEDREKTGLTINGHKVLGAFGDLPGVLHSNVVDNVVFVVPRLWFEKIESLIRLCEIEGIPASVAVDLYELKFSKVKQTELHGLPLLTFESAPDKLWHLLLKRAFDAVFSGFLLLLSAPVLICAAIMIKITSQGPVFFKQVRCGLNGRRFTLYKFRTMFTGAEEELVNLHRFNEMSGPVFKMKNDPRVTKAGRFLRKFSIDELPQLWNVFKADMSIVGPRPALPSEVDKYDSWQRRRLSMRPGLTCLWQVEGRNKIKNFDEWIKLDLEYIDSWSLGLDFRLFFKTIPVVLLAKGAE